MLKNVIFALGMFGCAKHTTPPVPNMHDLSNYAGAEFEPTSSVCLDGLLVNLGVECSTLVEIVGEGVISYMQCHKAKNNRSPWDKYTFIVIGDHNLGTPPDAVEFCVDPFSVIYIQERP